jgi:hypothetical protein
LRDRNRESGVLITFEPGARPSSGWNRSATSSTGRKIGNAMTRCREFDIAKVS